MKIEWSEEQDCFVALLPGEPIATGASQEEAERRGNEELQRRLLTLIESNDRELASLRQSIR